MPARAQRHPQSPAGKRQSFMPFQQRFHCKTVRIEAEAANHPLAGTGYQRLVTELLPLVDIRDVHFDDRSLHRTDRILQRKRRVGVCARIEHDAVAPETRFMDSVNQLTFHIRLEIPELHRRIPLLQLFQKTLERFRPVDRRLPPAQQIEIRAIDNLYLHRDKHNEWSCRTLHSEQHLLPQGKTAFCPEENSPLFALKQPAVRHKGKGWTNADVRSFIFNTFAAKYGAKIRKEMETSEKNKIIMKYRQYLKLEKSLSVNTVSAYLTDLNKLLSYLSVTGTDFREVTLDTLEDFSAGLRDIGIHPRSQARILSGIRSFYHFLLLEDYIRQDPTELLESPQIGKHLPDVLSVGEIDALIGAIDRSSREGQRNRAILETLYSCGLRVSELCGLKISDLYLEEGFIKVEGKGSKQRLVPISPRAVNELKNYFPDRNAGLIKPGYEDFVFISRFGKNISRIMVFHIIKELAAQTGLKKTVSPHTFRHSFATHLLEGGANLRAIQCMLGHESIGTTEIYTHIDRQLLRDEIISHHPRNSLKK